MQDAALFLLIGVVFPLWVLAGFADWVCHARTGIAATSGLTENALHWLMYAQVGAGIAAVAVFELNAAVLAIVAAVFMVHQLTVYWELQYSTIRRDVAPFEQMVHSAMEMLPLASLLLLVVIAWPVLPADWTLVPRRVPWRLDWLAGAVAATVLLNALPLAQETVACWRGRTRRREQEPREPRLEPRF